jgi:hypothetical protein
MLSAKLLAIKSLPIFETFFGADYNDKGGGLRSVKMNLSR